MWFISADAHAESVSRHLQNPGEPESSRQPSTIQNRVLFVEDEPLVQEMYASLASDLPDYTIHTVSSGLEGLELFAEHRFDVVITDLSMPGMNGVEFLRHVVERQPDSVRIIISGYADQLRFAETFSVGHRYFVKPCGTRELVRLLQRLAQFRHIIENETVRKVIGGLGSLPPASETYLKLNEALRSRYTSLQDVVEIVERDADATAKLLQMVNSALFGFSRRLENASDAVQLLGIDLLNGLVVGLQAFIGCGTVAQNEMTQVWNHNLEIALLCRCIARHEQFNTEQTEQCFTVGLLHDIGKLILHGKAPKAYGSVLAEATTRRLRVSEAEERAFGTTHAEIGAYLLTLWGLPENIVNIVAHHDEGRCDNLSSGDTMSLAILHGAHCLCPHQPGDEIVEQWLEQSGFSARLTLWREAVSVHDSGLN